MVSKFLPQLQLQTRLHKLMINLAMHDEIGYNYRMPNINAAIGVAQLEQLPKFLTAKRKLAKAYSSFFSNLTSNLTLTFIFLSKTLQSSHHPFFGSYWHIFDSQRLL